MGLYLLLLQLSDPSRGESDVTGRHARASTLRDPDLVVVLDQAGSQADYGVGGGRRPNR